MTETDKATDPLSDEPLSAPLNRLPEDLLEGGLSYLDYRSTVRSNDEVFDEVYRDPGYTQDDLSFLSRLPALTVVALAEDWCPDVFHTLPTWARVAEEVEGWDLKIFPRDDNPRLMEAFLWKGGAQRIPVYAFYDRNLQLQCWWSGRGREAQEALDELLAGRSFDELEEAEQARAKALFDEGYPARFRRANFEEILDLLSAFFHLER